MNKRIDYEAGIVNRGNWNLIKNSMRKAKRGEPVTVGFLGGSITQGCLSSVPEKCYAYRVYQWWVNKFSDATVTYINAGVGGTSSHFGVARADADLLSYNPDFSIVEFSVNDENTAHFKETYEGLIRKILQHQSHTSLMLVHNVFYDDNVSAEDVHQEIGRHYQIPEVSMRTTILPLIQNGTIKNGDITSDNLHPNDLGHEMVADVIIYLLEKIYDDLDNEEDTVSLPAPITQDQYENARRYQSHNYQAKLMGFMPDKRDVKENFVNGWTAFNKDDKIELKIEGSCIAIQYRKTIQRPTPIAKAVIDGDLEHAVLLDGNFSEDWGDCLYMETVCEHVENKIHTVEIEVIETHEDDKVPFYLLSVIGSSRE